MILELFLAALHPFSLELHFISVVILKTSSMGDTIHFCNMNCLLVLLFVLPLTIVFRYLALCLT